MDQSLINKKRVEDDCRLQIGKGVDQLFMTSKTNNWHSAMINKPKNLVMKKKPVEPEWQQDLNNCNSGCVLLRHGALTRGRKISRLGGKRKKNLKREKKPENIFVYGGRGRP